MGKKHKKKNKEVSLMDFDLSPEEQQRMLLNFTDNGYVPDDEDDILDSSIEDALFEKFGFSTEEPEKNVETESEDVENTNHVIEEVSVDDLDNGLMGITINISKENNIFTLLGPSGGGTSIRLNSIKEFDNPINDDINIMSNITKELSDIIITSIEPSVIIPYDTFNECVLQIVSNLDESNIALYKASYDNKEYILLYYIDEESNDTMADMFDDLISSKKLLPFTDAILKSLCDNEYVAYDFNRDFNESLLDEDETHKYINAILSDSGTEYYSGIGMSKSSYSIKNLNDVKFSYRPLIQRVSDKMNGVHQETTNETDSESETE